MTRLQKMEEKFALAKLKRNDPNRDFVIDSANHFLGALPVAEANVIERDGSSSSGIFEQKRPKKEQVYMIDKGRKGEQARADWESALLKNVRQSERIYMTQSATLHPFAVVSYLPYKAPN